MYTCMQVQAVQVRNKYKISTPFRFTVDTNARELHLSKNNLNLRGRSTLSSSVLSAPTSKGLCSSYICLLRLKRKSASVKAIFCVFATKFSIFAKNKPSLVKNLSCLKNFSNFFGVHGNDQISHMHPRPMRYKESASFSAPRSGCRFQSLFSSSQEKFSQPLIYSVFGKLRSGS